MARTPRPKKAKLDDLAGVTDPRAPLDSAALLGAARPLLARLEVDLRARAAGSPAVTRALEERYEQERKAERTAESFAGWSAALATQVAAAWLLSCVFVRTLEDRGLLRQARLAGPGALDSQRLFFQLAPSLTERDYLLMVFRELATHPAARDLFDAEHSLVWKLSPSADLAKELLALFRTPSADAPAFRFGQASTRFLGDLYQDVSEDVRKRYALLQTPDFVEAFILDRTLEPAIARFGLDDTTLIDPTCGSGHFLLGAFDRLFEHRLRAEPGVDKRVAATKALDAVYGVDINPYAVAIARFRLTLSFLEKAGFAKLADAPRLPMHVVVADSLRINPQHSQRELWQVEGADSERWLGDMFALEDEAAARTVLARTFAAVVGNPPYITEKDAAKRDVYRRMYKSAAMQFSLAAPFCERFFQLARPTGYVGQITANSFMKREFGKRLIEGYLPTVNLELIVNTSGAYIPGHGTPTVLLFGTHEPPIAKDVLAMLAKRGEPSTPDDPAKGVVWTSIVEHWQDVGFENDYVSIARVDRATLGRHPWSLGGGGVADLKELLEARAECRLGEMVVSVGRVAHTGNDEAFVAPAGSLLRAGLPASSIAPFVEGEIVRDWSLAQSTSVAFPYTSDLTVIAEIASDPRIKYLWPYRTMLWERREPNGTHREIGLTWYEFSRFHPERFVGPCIAFAFVATHNHFVFDRGGKVFKQTAPIIKLPADATEDDHLALLAYLNSSTACFWMKQVFFPKYGAVKADHPDPARNFYEFAGTGLAKLPMPTSLTHDPNMTRLAKELVHLGEERVRRLEVGAFRAAATMEEFAGLAGTAWRENDADRRRMVFLQEEIDWRVYSAFGLTGEDVVLEVEEYECATLTRGQRVFEEVEGRLSLVRRDGALLLAAEAEVETSPPSMRSARQLAVAAARKAAVDSIPEVSLLESNVYKRMWRDSEQNETESAFRVRWAADAWKTLCAERVEERLRQGGVAVASGRTLLEGLEAGILADESIPFVGAQRYTESGMRKFLVWLGTWEAQRAEDLGQPCALEPLAPPARFEPADFSSPRFYTLRGKLDVPKERFISYPGCESDEDGEPIYGWAGWNHLQRAQALASLYMKRKDGEGWAKDRLTPMLAGLLELVPWVKQWHNDPSDEFGGLRMGDYFEQFLDGECRLHGLSHDDLRLWRPAKKSARKPKATKAEVSADAKPAPARRTRKKRDPAAEPETP